MGYGSRAINSLNAYYSGEYFNLDEPQAEMDTETETRNRGPETNDSVCTIPPFIVSR